MRRFWPATIMAFFLLSTAVTAAWPCVGKTLQLGVIPSGEEKLLTEMLSILVNERTGTSVKIREFGSFRECFMALEKNEIDIVVAFAGQGYLEVFSSEQVVSPEDVMEQVGKSFNQRFNLVWLKPWGLTDGGRFLRSESGVPVHTQAAPLARKDTLKEFPALARLVNKMSGRLDDGLVGRLLTEVKSSDAHKVARKYLRSEKLI